MGRLCLSVKVGEKLEIGGAIVIVEQASCSRAKVVVIADRSINVRRQSIGRRGSEAEGADIVDCARSWDISLDEATSGKEKSDRGCANSWGISIGRSSGNDTRNTNCRRAEEGGSVSKVSQIQPMRKMQETED